MLHWITLIHGQEFKMADEEDPEEYERERLEINREWIEGLVEEIDLTGLGEIPSVMEGKPPYNTAKDPLKLVPAPIQAFSKRKYPPMRWVVKPIFSSQEAVSMIVGESGSFKTWISLELARCVSLGIPFFGFEVPEVRKVLYFNLEMPEPLVQERTNGLGMTEEFIGNIQLVNSPSRPIDLMNTDDFIEALELVATQKPGLIIFDTFSKLHTSASNEVDNDKMTELVLAARRLAEAGGCLVILLHHTNKYNPEYPKPKLERIRGASTIRDNMMNILFLSSKKTKDGAFYVEAELIKSWSGEIGLTFAKQLVVEKDEDEERIQKAEWIDYEASGDEDVVYDEIVERLHFFFGNPNAYQDGIPMTVFRGTPKSRKNPNGDLTYAALDRLATILKQMEDAGLVKIEREDKEGGRKLIYKGELWD